MQRLLPPVLVVVLLALMALLHRLLPVPRLVPPSWAMLAVLPIASGLLLLVVARVQFLRLRTNIHTFRTPDRLARAGVFRLSRNPMYLGFLLVLMGAAWMSGTLAAWAAPLLFYAAAALWYIPYEEAMLERAFGDQWRTYRRTTRRWL
jgi:protein-S-isoprenylcysteine O-methyltransferase Ste14